MASSSENPGMEPTDVDRGISGLFGSEQDERTLRRICFLIEVVFSHGWTPLTLDMLPRLCSHQVLYGY